MTRIMVSAGHHPEAPGACVDQFCEHDEAVRWARLIVDLIRDRDVSSWMCPRHNLSDKVAYINRFGASLAIEVHFNSAVDADGNHIGRGCETLYHPKSPNGRIAAQAIHDALAPIFPPGRGAKEGWHWMDRPGHEDYPGDVEGDERLDYFLAATRCPAVIIEPQFIHLRHDIQGRMLEGCTAIADVVTDIVRGTFFKRGY